MHYLTLQYVPHPLAPYRGMRKLAPATRLVFEHGGIQVDRYWQLPSDEDESESTHEEILEELDQLLRDATRSRLLADVPLGAFLSGGVDSSLVVSYMAEAQNQVKTFTIDVPMTGYSEREHARNVAALFGTEHHEYVVEAELVPSLAQAVRHAGEPFADSSAIPTYLISQATRQHVTVALSGDGGDEAFGGYDRYLRAMQIDNLPSAAKIAARVMARVSPQRLTARNDRIRLAAALLASGDPHERYATMVTHFPPIMLERMCRPEFIEAAGGVRRAWDDVLALPGSDTVNRYLRLDVGTYLPDDILVKVDRMSMAHALEVRSPFLDYRVHEFAARLPGHYKIRRNTTKWLLKQLALRRGLPMNNVHRPKMGFRIPVGTWLRGPLKSWITDLVLSPEARGRGYFVEPVVRQLLREHLDGRRDHEGRLWNLAMLELWHRTSIDRF
jgi:asparagine synthase (glutamine-hydrolysing)